MFCDQERGFCRLRDGCLTDDVCTAAERCLETGRLVEAPIYSDHPRLDKRHIAVIVGPRECVASPDAYRCTHLDSNVSYRYCGRTL